MENGKQAGSPYSSSSSFTNDLFGSKDSPSPSSPNGIFSSIFPPPSAVLGKRTPRSGMESMNKYYAENLVGNRGITEDANRNKDGTNYCPPNKEGNSIFQERSEPCPLSSSLYYGGQEDMYVLSSNAKNMGSHHDFKKEGGQGDKHGDESHIASRGNWWEGSLYY